MSISRISAALLGATVIAAIAVGCAPATPTPTATPTVTVTSTASPTPTPTADASDPVDWVVTADGIGPVSLGEVLSDAATAMPTGSEIPEYCAWTAWWSAPDSSYQLVAATDGADESGAVTVVEAGSPPDNTAVLGPRTAEGVGIGSTIDEVRAAYPDVVEVPEPTNEDGTAFDGGDGAPHYLRVQDAIIFTYYTGADIVQAVTVTAQPVPPYEYCG